MKFIIDLDDTLVSSTLLNNDAYNFALEKFGYARIFTTKRITRNNLSFIPPPILQNIIHEKQNYFSLPWMRYRLVLNEVLIKKLKASDPKNNFIWTKADKNRVLQILEQCNLSKYFNQIIFDEKENLKKSLSKLENVTNSPNFIIYENNKEFFSNYNIKIIDNIQNGMFDISGYLFFLILIPLCC
ncbi:MAG: hypothetical protein RR400_03005 [Clostridia bacterium]